MNKNEKLKKEKKRPDIIVCSECRYNGGSNICFDCALGDLFINAKNKQEQNLDNV